MVSTRGERVRYVYTASTKSGYQSRQAKAKGQKTSESSDEEDHNSSVVGRISRPPKKRARGDSAPVRLGVDRSGLLNLPVEILFMVCLDLEPPDLLNLSRLTKSFRAVLLSRENRSVWEGAIERVKGLPSCPPDLSHPEYASLMFETDCQGCPSPKARTDYVVRLRFCDTCLIDHTVTEDIIRNDWPDVPETFLRAMPRSWNFNRRSTPLYIRQLVVDAKRIIDSEKEGSAAYHNVLNDIHQSLAKLNTMLKSTARGMIRWAEGGGRQRRELLRQERFQDISQRLSLLGWDPKDLPSRSEIQDWDGNVMEMIFSPKTFTDRAWKDLYPKLTPLLKLHKQRRLRREAQGRLAMKRNVVWQYFKEWMNEEPEPPEPTIHPHPSFFLEPRKLFAVPAIAKFIKSSGETTISEDLWIKNVAKVAAANRTNQERIIAALRLVLAGRPHPQKMQSLLMGKDPFEDLQVQFDPSTEVSADDLFAPIAVFFCTKCKAPLWFPDLLIHECCLVTPWTPGAYGNKEWLDKTFHTSKLQAASRICSFIPRLVGDLELSSGVTYSEAMDLGKVFLCLRCDELVAETMSFNKLVQHYVDECRWYQSMESHLSKNPAAPTPDSDDDDDELPVFIHTHGDQDGGRLACLATEAQLERLKQIRERDGARQRDLIQSLDTAEPCPPWWHPTLVLNRGRRRTCNLCPKLSSCDFNKPMNPIEMEVHIRTRHAKTPDLLVHSKRFG